MQWYYSRGEKSFGPVEQEELFRLARSGGLAPGDLVWNPTMGEKWAPASSVDGLFDVPPALAPPFPPPGASMARGQTHNRELMRMARESLAGRWGIAIGASLLYWVIFAGIGSVVPCIGSLATLIISGAMSVGLCIVFLTVARRGQPDIGQLFAGFKVFGPSLGAYLLVMVFVLLWTLLLIIPGIVAALGYSMTFYIMADDPQVGPMEAITRSKEMMRGRKWKLFCLEWRFFGWFLLCLLTCGIGFFWLLPYMQTAVSHFYDDVRPLDSRG